VTVQGRSDKRKVASVQHCELQIGEHQAIVVIKVDDHIAIVLPAMSGQFVEAREERRDIDNKRRARHRDREAWDWN
jgi:hypothetical protein